MPGYPYQLGARERDGCGPGAVAQAPGAQAATSPPASAPIRAITPRPLSSFCAPAEAFAPHIAQIEGRTTPGLDARTTRHAELLDQPEEAQAGRGDLRLDEEHGVVCGARAFADLRPYAAACSHGGRSLQPAAAQSFAAAYRVVASRNRPLPSNAAKQRGYKARTAHLNAKKDRSDAISHRIRPFCIGLLMQTPGRAFVTSRADRTTVAERAIQWASAIGPRPTNAAYRAESLAASNSSPARFRAPSPMALARPASAAEPLHRRRGFRFVCKEQPASLVVNVIGID